MKCGNMSRIGKQPINVPDGVDVTINSDVVVAKGKLGELSVQIPDVLKVTLSDKVLTVAVARETSYTAARWGLCRALIFNIIKGVSDGFEKKLEIHGVGYRAEMKGQDLVLHLGYSHPVVMNVPEGIKVTLEKQNGILVFGADRQKVGQFAANIRKQRKPEPYKGKGIRYEGEYVRRKIGKRAVAGG